MTKREIETEVYNSVIKYGRHIIMDVVRMRFPQPIKVKAVGHKDEIEIDYLCCCKDSLHKPVFYCQTNNELNYFDTISINSQKKILDYINKTFKN